MRNDSPLPRVSVVGSGSRSHAERAGPLGEALARLGVHLITGGGGGVMAEVARSFTGIRPRRGLSVGILPAAEPQEEGPPGLPPGYPNPWVELPVTTHLAARGDEGRSPGSRNHLVVLTGDAVVALPGSAGTLSEVELSLVYARPVACHLSDPGELPGLPPDAPLLPSLDDVLAFLADALEI